MNPPSALLPMPGHEVRQLAGVPKLALDFLRRPARMTARQHGRCQVHNKQDGENSRGNGNTTAAREGIGMALALMRWPQCLLCEEFALSHVEIAADATRPEKSINDRRDNVLRTQARAHALNCGGAIV
jgi:hypothetical protein